MPATSGTWVFESPDGTAEEGDPQYPSGSVVFLTGTGNPSDGNTPDPTCADLMDVLQLSTWQINGPLGLCVDPDPDSPCAGEPWVWQRK